jgi:tryptophan synthase beta chain
MRWQSLPKCLPAICHSIPICCQVPETLIGALKELEEEYAKAMADPAFQARGLCASSVGSAPAFVQAPTLSRLPLQAQFASILKDYVGRESPLYHAERLSEHYRK